MRLLFLGLALIASNFLYQLFNGGNWEIALDRSYFQSVAIFCVFLNSKIYVAVALQDRVGGTDV